MALQRAKTMENILMSTQPQGKSTIQSGGFESGLSNTAYSIFTDRKFRCMK